MSNNKEEKKEYPKDDLTYEIEERAEDDLNSTIAKRGQTVRFTIADIVKSEQAVTSTLKELNAKANVHAAEMINIEKNHPFVKEFDEMQIHTLGLYCDAVRGLAMVEPYIEEYEKALQESAKERAEICKAVGIENPVLIDIERTPVAAKNASKKADKKDNKESDTGK